MTTLMFVSSWLGTTSTDTQLVVLQSAFCCKVKVVGAEGKTTATALPPAWMIGSKGAPGFGQHQ